MFAVSVVEFNATGADLLVLFPQESTPDDHPPRTTEFRRLKVPVIFGPETPRPRQRKLTGPFTQVLAIKHENQSDHQLNEKSQDLLYTNVQGSIGHNKPLNFERLRIRSLEPFCFGFCFND